MRIVSLEHYKVFESTLDLLVKGWPTPLVKLRSYSRESLSVWAKLEFYNPFSKSVKDRPVWNMLVKALKKGGGNGKLYEATSGNAGIALASLSNIYGLKFRAYVPAPTPKATEVLLKFLGAEVVRTNYQTIDLDIINYVCKEAARDNALNLNQFFNDDNFEVHYLTTARELDLQVSAATGRPPDVIVAGIGTSGHLAAIIKYFNEKYGAGKVRFVGVVPAQGDSIPGIKRLETKPKWIETYKPDVVVEVRKVEAVEKCREVALREGLLIGLSSGAVMVGLEEAIKIFGDRGTYVTVFSDDGFKYVEVFSKYLEGKLY